MTQQNEDEVVIEWKDLPVRPVKPKSRVEAIVEELKKFPGRSARVARNVKSSSATATWRNRGCKAQVRQAEDSPKLFDVYAWWPAADEKADVRTKRKS